MAINPVSGRLGQGLLLTSPAEKLGALPWNGARFVGHLVSAFKAAVAMAVKDMSILPPHPIVSWDIVPTSNGPVLVEGNACGNWILTIFPPDGGEPPASLAPLLSRWVESRVLR